MHQLPSGILNRPPPNYSLTCQSDVIKLRSEVGARPNCVCSTGDPAPCSQPLFWTEARVGLEGGSVSLCPHVIHASPTTMTSDFSVLKPGLVWGSQPPPPALGLLHPLHPQGVWASLYLGTRGSSQTPSGTPLQRTRSEASSHLITSPPPPEAQELLWILLEIRVLLLCVSCQSHPSWERSC
jgi:hypothetical protein